MELEKPDDPSLVSDFRASGVVKEAHGFVHLITKFGFRIRNEGNVGSVGSGVTAVEGAGGHLLTGDAPAHT